MNPDTDDGSWRTAVLDTWADLVSRVCPPLPYVLEPMCGLGAQARALVARLGGRALGFDINPEVVALAKRLFEGPAFECKCLDLRTLPTFAERFDVVVFGYEALNAHPVSRWPMLLAWARTHCTAGSVMILDVCGKGRGFGLRRGPGLFIDCTASNHLFTVSCNAKSGIRISRRYVCGQDELLGMIKDHGFGLIGCETPFANVNTDKPELRVMKTVILVAE
ncbi:class I SAM-dependent methyltransferase [Thalassobaculum litoreum]|uniref:class I SAM-dependent methyltransferase n=1 Tax=Thalassobaculum litoreum TaxID=420996 RepID=UPI001587945A|nr:class I SAM-dependent methyltransferase [Thalassobaculum litoreum]